jgi:hypothetical protein
LRSFRLAAPQPIGRLLMKRATIARSLREFRLSFMTNAMLIAELLLM